MRTKRQPKRAPRTFPRASTEKTFLRGKNVGAWRATSLKRGNSPLERAPTTTGLTRAPLSLATLLFATNERMPSPSRKPPPTSEEKRLVLAAFRRRKDWQAVAHYNGMARATAWRVVQTNRVDALSRGGARAASMKCTPAIEEALERYINDNCSYTLSQMRDMVAFDFSVDISTLTISRRLLDKLYTIKQVRMEPSTCNNEINKEKRKKFADKLVQHQEASDYIVYYDETNFNLYCKRTQGRAVKGERATVELPPSKGANLQIQCAVSVADGVVLHRLERGSIKMQQNAEYAEAVYHTAKASSGYQQHYSGKKIVIVLDNAPAHHQTEIRVPTFEDAVLLRLGPYSPMCNPIKGCFSVLKAEIKAFLRLSTDMMLTRDGDFSTWTEQRMSLLEQAAKHSMACMTSHLVMVQHTHALRAVEAARRFEDMQYCNGVHE